MPIYTRQGDEGDTAHFGGRTVRKSDISCEAIGTLDELCACLGWCRTEAVAARATQLADTLERLQSHVMMVGAMFSAGEGRSTVSLGASEVTAMELQIDDAWKQAGPLKHFILPGGCELASRLHVARTLCRRAERRLVSAGDSGYPLGPEVLTCINRMSDLLFALARLANRIAGSQEVIWAPRE